MLHLAVFRDDFAEKIFTAHKTIEARLSKIKCAPFEQIEKGDLVLIKQSGGPVVGYFQAGDVKFYDEITPDKLKQLIKKNWNQLAMTEEFWEMKKKSKYATLIQIKKPTKFRLPVAVKKKSLNGWIVLGGKSQEQLALI